MRAELKVGNIVGHDFYLYKNPLIPFIILEFEDQNNRVKIQSIKDHKILDVHNSTLLPVPLTIERIVKLHFSQIGNSFVESGCWISPNEKGFLFKINEHTMEALYVHQLQNFYFEHKQEVLSLPFLNKYSHKNKK